MSKTVSGIREDLVGKKLIIDGWNTEICDTTETESGTIYFAVEVRAIPAMYLENRWHEYNSNVANQLRHGNARD